MNWLTLPYITLPGDVRFVYADHERDWADGTLTIPPSLLKSECGMCHGRFEPSEMVARIPAGTDLRHACLSCWNDSGEWRQEERDRRKAEFYSRMGWR